MFQSGGYLPWSYTIAAGVAEEGEAAPSGAIGQIQTVSGSVTVTRGGGTTVHVKAGDLVFQGDAIETAADGAVGITFIDGTAFSLSDSARMVLDEFARDPKGAATSALFGIARGTFAFIAGKLAKTGGLRIDTPVASVQGRAQGSGLGILTLAAFTFAVIEESRSQPAGGPVLDGDYVEDDHILPDYSSFTVTTHEATPRVLEVKELDRALVIRLTGSTAAVDYVTLTPAQQQANRGFSNEVSGLQQAAVSFNPTNAATGGGSNATFAFIPATVLATTQTAAVTTTTTAQSGSGSGSGGRPQPHTDYHRRSTGRDLIRCRCSERFESDLRKQRRRAIFRQTNYYC